MSEIADFPYFEIKFGKDGTAMSVDSNNLAQTFVNENGLTDLFIISHGWNNDRSEAFDLYRELFGSVRSQLAAGAVDLSGRVIGVLGIIWPSKKFRDMENATGANAAGIGGHESDETVTELLDELTDALGTHEASASIENLKILVPELEDDPAARRHFADGLRELLPRDASNAEDASNQFFAASADELFSNLEAPILFNGAASGGGGAASGIGSAGGGAAGLGDLHGGAMAAARRLLNYATYYLMKARAGKVGEIGVSGLVRDIRQAKADLKVHFVGHSFGGRVLTAAANRLGGAAAAKPTSMCLLQAAFSHNGFAEAFKPGQNGYFRSVLSQDKVAGPIIITHTHKDTANAIAYPIASRVAGQNAATLGGPEDEYGAIGANGARHTPEAIDGELLDPGAADYAFSRGKIYNLRSDEHISGHGDVRGAAVAFAILSAVVVT